MLLISSLVVFLIKLVDLEFISLEICRIGNSLSSLIIILSAWLTIIIISADYYPKSKSLFLGVLFIILLFLVMCFSVEGLLTYYFFFEAALIPIFYLVIGWGYQPERLSAALYMFFYTIVASLPLLLMIVLIIEEGGRLSLIILPFIRVKINNDIFIIMTTAAFLVKFPIYFFHLWLPKAHVEAPVSGSIILAGVLLKLGGYGLFLVSLIIIPSYLVSVGFILRVSLVGSRIVAINILRCTDLKVAIAYSSVVHIRIIIVVLLSVRFLGLVGGVWILVAHGLTSSGIFRGANIIYERTHTRRLVANKGFIRILPSFSLYWFLLVVLNFAGPFTLNLFREIMMINTLISVSLIFIAPIRALCFFSAAYNLVIYASRQQGKRVRVGLIYNNLSLRESTVLFSHIWPCVIFLGGLLLLINNLIRMWIL